MNEKKAGQVNQDKGTLQLKIENDQDLKEVIDYMEDHSFHSRVIIHDGDEEALFNKLLQFYTLVDAAGGLVWNSNNELLLIYRHNKWDLPKGKIEQSESIEEAALREVSEECGIQELHDHKWVQTSFHTYKQQEELVLKRTFWYEMHCLDPDIIKPQKEEGITDICWCDKAGVQAAMENTFPNLKGILQSCIQGAEQQDNYQL